MTIVILVIAYCVIATVLQVTQRENGLNLKFPTPRTDTFPYLLSLSFGSQALLNSLPAFPPSRSSRVLFAFA